MKEKKKTSKSGPLRVEGEKVTLLKIRMVFEM